VWFRNPLPRKQPHYAIYDRNDESAGSRRLWSYRSFLPYVYSAASCASCKARLLASSAAACATCKAPLSASDLSSSTLLRYESQTTKSPELIFSALVGDEGTRDVRFERVLCT
jgi:hypothetical protein